MNNTIYRQPSKDRKTLEEMVAGKISTLHAYIRDNTKISNEDKPFFIAIILISLQKESFREIIKKYKYKIQKQFIYDLLIDNLKEYDIDATIFEFMKNDSNNKHFKRIIKIVLDIFTTLTTQGSNIDLLNVFYTEFVRYNNTDSKSLGIVLTPPYIVQLMVKLLNIQPNDVVLDLCTGTGSFIWEAMAATIKPKQIIGCEYQNKLFGLLKCNKILRNLADDQCALYNDDCFKIKFDGATKSIINPPYGMRDKSVMDFILKQIKSVDDGGLVISIIPISNLKKSTAIRKTISDSAKILTIIKCSEKIFHPTSSVKTCILLLKKSDQGHQKTDLTKIIDYTEDGFEVKRGKGRCKTEYYETRYKYLMENINNIKSNQYKINLDGDWTQIENTTPMVALDPLVLKKQVLEIDYQTAVLNLNNTIIKSPDAKTYKKFKITDLFDIVKKPTEKYNKPLQNIVNIIAAKNNNNGVKEHGVADRDNTFSGNKIVLVCGGDGGAGMAWYQASDFKISSTTAVLIPKNIKLDKPVGVYCATELSKYKAVYSRGYAWTLEKIKSDTIALPITTSGDIDYDFIYSLF